MLCVIDCFVTLYVFTLLRMAWCLLMNRLTTFTTFQKTFPYYKDHMNVRSIHDQIFKIEFLSQYSFWWRSIVHMEHVVVSGGSRRRRSVGCSTVSGALAGCDVTKPKVTSSTKYSFTFWSCLAPRVTAVSPSSGTAKDTITITGLVHVHE